MFHIIINNVNETVIKYIKVKIVLNEEQYYFMPNIRALTKHFASFLSIKRDYGTRINKYK